MDGLRHVLRPSPARRGFGLAVQTSLGVLLLWLAVAHPPEGWGWWAFLVALGGLTLATAWRGWRGGTLGLVLEEDGLRQEDGEWIAPLDNVAAVDRALFSFKPSNGFLIRLKEPMDRRWMPGMWWRIGRRVGIGGVTGGAETKVMADILTSMIARRDAPHGPD
jgi:hypothetical protein